MEKTVFFKSCLGVFQGGGCRAAAFAGAYEEAARRGVSFSEVAGTSAGSIIAALIGAGASPSFVKERLTSLDFLPFMALPERRKRRPLFSMGTLVHIKDPRYADLYFDQGFFSSRHVQIWIENLLKELLPSEKSPIAFKALPYPTYIISTDLARYEAKVWCRESTPDDSVAEAVRASCSIPIFYQPFENRHVDGGVLSNLPTFVFANRGAQRQSLSSKVLAFCLKGDEDGPLTWSNTNEYLLSLSNAIVDGNTRLQLELQPEVNVVTIPTGGVHATDFAKMNRDVSDSLIIGGANATRKFFDEERLHIRQSSQKDICYDADEFYCRITQALEMPIEKIIISENNTDWVYKLFPTVFSLRQAGAQVEAILPQNGDRAGDGPYRRRLLKALGVKVTILSDETFVPLRATLILPKDASQNRAIVGIATDPKAECDSVQYSGYLDAGVIDTIRARLEALTHPSDDDGVPVLVTATEEETIAPLRNLSQYANSDHVRISIETIRLEKIVATTRLVREYKYNQIKSLIDMYRRLGIELFAPAAVKFANGMKSLVTPPVVEESGDRYVLIEGSTRATFCRDEGIDTFKCIVVRGVTAPLPSGTYPFARIRLTGRQLPVSDRYEGFTYANFRHIERAMHPIESLQD